MSRRFKDDCISNATELHDELNSIMDKGLDITAEAIKEAYKMMKGNEDFSQSVIIINETVVERLRGENENS